VNAGLSVLLEWIHALVAGLAGAIYREHKPAELRSAGQPGPAVPTQSELAAARAWQQHERGRSRLHYAAIRSNLMHR